LHDDLGVIHPAPAGVAVLVDGENVNTLPAAEILRGVGAAEKAAVRRVYGNATQVAAGAETPGFRLVHTLPGKNSADILLSIDAVHLSHEGGIKTFVIITSDGDFSHLAHHLRERHFRVIGLGEPKTPEVFRAACSQFIEIKTVSKDQMPKSSGSNALSAMNVRLRKVILENGNKSGTPISRLNAPMCAFGTKISALQDKTWRDYLTKRPKLFACDPKGPNARVRWIGPQS
jgi:hypothetical protein